MEKENSCDICSKPSTSKCAHCGRYFCSEHEKPKLSMSFKAYQLSKDRIIENEWRKENAHACPEYGEWLKKKAQEKTDKSWEALDRLKKIETIPLPPQASEGLPENIKKMLKITMESEPEQAREVITGTERKTPIKWVIAMIVIIFTGWYLYSNPKIIQKFFMISSSTTSTTTQKISGNIPQITATTQLASQAMIIKVFIDTASGNGLTFFDNATVEAVRNGMRVWEEKTNRTISFVETNRIDATVTINWTKTLGGERIGVTYYTPGIISGSITLMPSGVLLRNQIRTMHELGHIIGLNHSTDVMSVMNRYEHYLANITNEDAEQAISIIRNYQK